MNWINQEKGVWARTSVSSHADIGNNHLVRVGLEGGPELLIA